MTDVLYYDGEEDIATDLESSGWGPVVTAVTATVGAAAAALAWAAARLFRPSRHRDAS